jgi:glucose 1-dehydrogenase/2-deoxy-D-gluconate 3-dehydrogenase
VPEQDKYVPLSKLFDLSSQGAVVTGGARGVGLGIARRLAEAGAGVLIADINAEGAKQAVEKLASQGFKAARVRCDVTKSSEVKAAMKIAVSTLGNVSILVNNAGIYPLKPIFDMTEVEWDEMIDTDLKGAYLCAQEASRNMVKQGRGGCIINIGSTASVQPSFVPGHVHYAAAKGGILLLTKSLAKELAPYGIRVNLIVPGGIDPRLAGQSHTGLSIDESAVKTGKEFLKRVPLGRMGRPDDIGTVALFLASEASSYMTGSLIVVDGGYLVS